METRLELQWNKSFLTCSFYCGLSTLWKLFCLPPPEQHFYPFTLWVGQKILFSSSINEFPSGVNIDRTCWNFSCLAGVLLLHFGFRGSILLGKQGNGCQPGSQDPGSLAGLLCSVPWPWQSHKGTLEEAPACTAAIFVRKALM